MRVSFSPRGRSGTGAPVKQGSVAWRSSDSSVASISLDSSNDLSATVIALRPGAALITASASAELGTEASEVLGAGAVIVLDRKDAVAGFELVFSTPQ